MHPAISVIFFTVLSGSGFGALAIVGLQFPISDSPFRIFIVSATGIGLASIGLICSTFHLGHPERAWRAFTQWRSSWLSREAVVAVAALCLYSLYALYWIIAGERLVWLGILASATSLLTVFATSMIYAQLKTVPHWNTALTPLTYLLFSLCSGFLFVAGSGGGEYHGKDSLVAIFGIAITLIAWTTKIVWWRRASQSSFDHLKSSTITATGLSNMKKVRLLEKPHSGPNYLTHEMVHVIGRKHARNLRISAIIIGGALPLAIVLLVFFGIFSHVAMLFAATAMVAGLFAERWLFFAEAKHSVSLYYDTATHQRQ